MFKVYCKECGKARPKDRTEDYCVPCANTGHNVRLVLSVEDAKRRIGIWSEHYNRHNYTVAQRLSIPSYVRLLRTIAKRAS